MAGENPPQQTQERQSVIPATRINNLFREEMHLFLARNTELEMEREEHLKPRAWQKQISGVAMEENM